MEASEKLHRAYLIATNRRVDRYFLQVEALVETLKEQLPELHKEYERHLETLEKRRKESMTSEPLEFLESEDQLLRLLVKYIQENS